MSVDSATSFQLCSFVAKDSVWFETQSFKSYVSVTVFAFAHFVNGVINGFKVVYSFSHV